MLVEIKQAMSTAANDQEAWQSKELREVCESEHGR